MPRAYTPPADTHNIIMDKFRTSQWKRLYALSGSSRWRTRRDGWAAVPSYSLLYPSE